jgi:glycosyltransferase involved in cell wall biosynthesis
MTARPLRVLHVLNTVRETGNGIINTAMDLAWGEAMRGHSVAVASFGGEFEQRLASWGVRHHRLDQRRRPLTIARAAWTLRGILSKDRPDIVHCHMMTGIVLARAARALGAPPFTLVGHVHNVYQRSARVMGFADAVLCCGTSVRETMTQRGVDAARLHVVLNGTVGTPRLPDPATVPPAALNHPSITTVAGMNARKGIAELIAAFTIVAASRPEAMLYLVGEGPDRRAFEELALRSPAAARIRFLGFERDPTPVLRATDIFVLASRRESFPIVIGEARSAGCAIVATSVDGVPESLDGGRAGMLVPPQDPPALAAALARLLDHPDERKRWAAAAREGLEAFRVERMVDETIALYRRVLAD